MIKIVNESGIDLNPLEELINDFMPFAQKTMGFQKPPSLFLKSDSENAKNPLGRTAAYGPDSLEIMIYVDGRHPKDILRSIAHELVHHTQNLRGDLDNIINTDAGYAQNDPHMREMEREAYEQGNLCFRDWEDSRKKTLNESIYYKVIDTINEGEQSMSLEDWKNDEINYRLMKKFGLIKEEEKKEEENDNKLAAANAAAMNIVVTDVTDEKRVNMDEDEDEEEEDLSEDKTLNEIVNSLNKEARELLNENKYWNNMKSMGGDAWDAATSPMTWGEKLMGWEDQDVGYKDPSTGEITPLMVTDEEAQKAGVGSAADLFGSQENISKYVDADRGVGGAWNLGGHGPKFGQAGMQVKVYDEQGRDTGKTEDIAIKRHREEQKNLAGVAGAGTGVAAALGAVGAGGAHASRVMAQQAQAAAAAAQSTAHLPASVAAELSTAEAAAAPWSTALTQPHSLSSVGQGGANLANAARSGVQSLGTRAGWQNVGRGAANMAGRGYNALSRAFVNPAGQGLNPWSHLTNTGKIAVGLGGYELATRPSGQMFDKYGTIGTKFNAPVFEPGTEGIAAGLGGAGATQIHDATSAMLTACGEDVTDPSQCSEKQFAEMVALMNQGVAAREKMQVGAGPVEYMSPSGAGYHSAQQAAKKRRNMYEDAPYAWGVNESQQFEIEDAVYEYLINEQNLAAIASEDAASAADLASTATLAGQTSGGGIDVPNPTGGAFPTKSAEDYLANLPGESGDQEEEAKVSFADAFARGDVRESNDNWYKSSLYESLKKKWAK